MHSDLDSRIEPLDLCKSGNFWQEQLLDLVPLIAAIAFTRSMGIRGWRGIPIYLIVTSASRWLIQHCSPSYFQTDLERVNPDLEQDVAGNVDYVVVHAIPKRLRLRIPLISQDITYGRRLENLLKSDVQVVNVRLNYQTASIIIVYKSADTNLSYWLKSIEMARE